MSDTNTVIYFFLQYHWLMITSTIHKFFFFIFSLEPRIALYVEVAPPYTDSVPQVTSVHNLHPDYPIKNSRSALGNFGQNDKLVLRLKVKQSPNFIFFETS